MLKKLFIAISLMVYLANGQAQAQSKREPIPLFCEENSVFFYYTLRDEIAHSSERVFAIARLGDGETNRLINRVRLKRIKDAISMLTNAQDRLVLAEGERIRGYGGVEVYLGSKLIFFLRAYRGSYLVMQCCECNWRTPIVKKGRINPLEECP